MWLQYQELLITIFFVVVRFLSRSKESGGVSLILCAVPILSHSLPPSPLSHITIFCLLSLATCPNKNRLLIFLISEAYLIAVVIWQTELKTGWALAEQWWLFSTSLLSEFMQAVNIFFMICAANLPKNYCTARGCKRVFVLWVQSRTMAIKNILFARGLQLTHFNNVGPYFLVHWHTHRTRTNTKVLKHHLQKQIVDP